MSAFHPLLTLAPSANICPVNYNSSVFERVGRLTAASLAVAVTAFIIELLWLERLLPMTSDQSQFSMGGLILVWLLVSVTALRQRRTWLLLAGVPLALFAPALAIGGISVSCAAFGDCP